MTVEEEIECLKRLFEEKPGDLDVAWRYWNGLVNVKGFDIRSGRYVADAFGQAALDSYQGAVAFAKAYQELVELSGEGPRKQYVSGEILAAIRDAIGKAAASDKKLLEWIIESVENDKYEL